MSKLKTILRTFLLNKFSTVYTSSKYYLSNARTTFQKILDPAVTHLTDPTPFCPNG